MLHHMPEELCQVLGVVAPPPAPHLAAVHTGLLFHDFALQFPTTCPSASTQELKELIASYQTLRESGRGPAIAATIISTARQCNMDRDCNLPPDETDTGAMPLDERDGIVGNVYRK